MENADKRPDILVGIAEWLSEDFEFEVVEELRSAGAAASVLRIPTGPYAGIELYLPTAVGLFIAAGFFNGFLSKAGEDAYRAVKKGTTRLFHKAHPLEIKFTGSPGKVRETPYSAGFAVGCELLPTLRVKLLIRKDVSPETTEAGIEIFLDLMRDIHAERVSEEDLRRLFPYKPVGGTVLVVYDAETQTILPVDGMADTPLAR